MTAEESVLLRALVQDRCGIHFLDESRALLERRLAPRLAALGLSRFDDYHRFLVRDPAGPAELDTALDHLTNNETYFYREPHQLRAFADEILPLLAGALAGERRLRIWSAGCSSGEEAHTISILVLRSRLFPGWDVEVLGTDISRRMLERARAGVYGDSAFRSPESEQLRPWFRAREGKWAVAEEVSRQVRFAHLNLLDGPGMAAVPAPLDAIFCRNVFIYFSAADRKRVLQAFHRALRPGGFLLLAASESLLQSTADFELVQLRSDLVYRRPAEASP